MIGIGPDSSHAQPPPGRPPGVILGIVITGVLILSAVVLLLRLLGGSSPADPPPHAGQPAGRGDIYLERYPLEGSGWRVIDQLSGHYALIVKVETDRIVDAQEIAHQIIEPVKVSFVEVLVYFYRPGAEGPLAAARVQWTQRDGYITIVYE